MARKAIATDRNTPPNNRPSDRSVASALMAENYSLRHLRVNLETVGFLDFGFLLRLASRVAADPG